MAERPVSGISESTAPVFYTPLPQSHADLPRASYLESDPRDSDFVPGSLASNNNNSAALLGNFAKPESAESLAQKPPPTKGRRRAIIIGGILASLVLIVLVVVLPVYFTKIKPNQRNSQSNTAPGSTPTSTSGGTHNGGSNTRATTGGDGSTIYTEDGSTFTYNNKFGGFWIDDPNDRFNDGAQPNSWTPPLNQSWKWGQDRIYGVNLGGLFVLEPFISPALFQKYPTAVDEWTLSALMAADSASGGLNQIEDHYKTFITEKDIAEIAGAGLNWVRIPIPYWAIETWPGEPFLAKTSWKYILRVFGWCRKYGLRVNLDLHTIPGSQNGYNHSGKFGQINFLNGVMGVANAQRALEYMRVFTEFISQPQYSNVVPMFGIMNEALLSTIGRDALTSFYLEAHTMMRGITGIGEGKGPFISIHDGFGGIASWAGFLPNSDRIALDSHPYFAFDNSPATAPIDTGTGSTAGGSWPKEACDRWAGGFNTSRSGFGVTFAGEFSNGFNDCGLFLRGTKGYTPTYGGNCDDWQDSSNWSAGTKAGLKAFAMASMDSFGDWFFWTWKVGNSTAGKVESPLWSYQLGLENGWIPTDPRTAVGTCASLGISGNPFNGPFAPWQTGGAGAGSIAAAVTQANPWPPAQISNAPGPVTALPTYTPTGPIVSLPPQTFTAVSGATPTKSANAGSGWFNAQDTGGAPAPISGCQYPDPWDAIDASLPSGCGGVGGAGAGTSVGGGLSTLTTPTPTPTTTATATATATTTPTTTRTTSL